MLEHQDETRGNTNEEVSLEMQLIIFPYGTQVSLLLHWQMKQWQTCHNVSSIHVGFWQANVITDTIVVVKKERNVTHRRETTCVDGNHGIGGIYWVPFYCNTMLPVCKSTNSSVLWWYNAFQSVSEMLPNTKSRAQVSVFEGV